MGVFFARTGSTRRLPIAQEREILMGFDQGYGEVTVKQHLNSESARTLRASLLGASVCRSGHGFAGRSVSRGKSG